MTEKQPTPTDADQDTLDRARALKRSLWALLEAVTDAHQHSKTVCVAVKLNEDGYFPASKLHLEHAADLAFEQLDGIPSLNRLVRAVEVAADDLCVLF